MSAAEDKQTGCSSGRRSPALKRTRPIAGLTLSCAVLGQLLSACSQDLECSDNSVQIALGRALDNLYAQSRSLAQVDITVNDIVVVQQSPQSTSCKALVHLDIDFVGQKQSRDVAVLYTAETTDKGNVLVTIRQ